MGRNMKLEVSVSQPKETAIDILCKHFKGLIQRDIPFRDLSVQSVNTDTAGVVFTRLEFLHNSKFRSLE